MTRTNHADMKACWRGLAARSADLAGASTTIERAGTLSGHAWTCTATMLVESPIVTFYTSTKRVHCVRMHDIRLTAPFSFYSELSSLAFFSCDDVELAGTTFRNRRLS
jgi:hypothetical protein